MENLPTDTIVKDPVNLPMGDKISSYAGKVTRTTHNNSLWVKIDEPNEHFRSEISFSILLHMLPGTQLVIAPDGSGTKPSVTDAARMHRYAARDLGAMTAGDVTRAGGCPVAWSNVCDVSTLGENENSEIYKAIQSIFDGLVDVSNILKIPSIKGETAEMSACVSSPNPNALVKFNWAGFMLGITHPDKKITGQTLAPGQVVVALHEHGFRSNGISLVREIMKDKFGEDWWSNKELVQKIATPSTIYDHFLADLNGWYNQENNFQHYLKPHSICHLSGGSFKAKFFEDILKKKGLSARLDHLCQPAEIVKQCAEWSGKSDKELYEKWSCGQGALVVLNSKDVDRFKKHANQFGVFPKVCGEITKEEKPQLEIISKFSGGKIIYE